MSIQDHLNAMSFAESAMARHAFGMPLPTGGFQLDARDYLAIENQMAGRPYDAWGRPQSRARGQSR